MKIVLQSFLIALATTCAVSAHAQHRREGVDEAMRVCANLAFSSDRDSCMAVLRDVRFVDSGAVRVCGSLSFSRYAAPCFSASLEKTYSPVEVDFCAAKSFDTEKVQCLQSSGRSAELDRPNRRILSLAYDALDNLRRGSLRRAESDVMQLIRELELDRR